MALSNEKVRNCIPHDLVSSIMSKLPLKALTRFKCVHKSWVLLFENPNFMNMYRKRFISNNSYDSDTCLLLKQTGQDLENPSSLYLISGGRFDNKVKLDWPPLFQEEVSDIKILGSGINGNICLYIDGISSKVVVWNPTIEEFKVIPFEPSVSVPPYVKFKDQLYGFGYDYVRDDYKIIRDVGFHLDVWNLNDARVILSLSDVLYNPFWEIFSLKNNSWRKLDLAVTTFYHNLVGAPKQVYMNGACHWLGKSETDMHNVYLVSFDLGNEEFFLTPIPSTVKNNINFVWVDTHLTVLNESIALISSQVQTTTFHISILGEIGVKESWIKLFIVGPLPFVGRPIGVGMNGEIFIAKEDNELARCDISTHTIQDLGIKGVSCACQVVIHKKSLISIAEKSSFNWRKVLFSCLGL